MRLYISGPMRGLSNSNFPAFNEAAKILRFMGHDVLSPADSFKDENGNPVRGLPRSEYLKHDIQLILICDGIVVLPDWQTSPGACFEVAEAFSIDIPVFEIVQLTKYEKGLKKIDPTSVVIPRENQYMRKLPLIGLLGFAKAGKDTAAQTLIERGWTRVAFADPLKAIAKHIGWGGSKEGFGRTLLQDLGVGVRQFLRPDAWVTAGEDAIELAAGPVVVTDVRFLNEITMIHRRRGHLIRIDRPGVEAVNAHVSEHEWQQVEPDYVVTNDGTLDQLSERVLKVVSEIHPGWV